MEIEKRPPEIAKKLWNIVRIVFYMMSRSKAKRKIMLELDMLLKKGKDAGKALTNLILHHHHHHYSALTCRSADATAAFVSPREVEFSCSNTPLYPSYHPSKRKHHHHHHYQAEELKVMHKVFGILSRYDVATATAAAAAAAASPLPGLGRSPAARVTTDSPFASANDRDHDHLQVDKDAEEFIKKFYRELKKQKPAALESPSPYHEWATYLR